MTARLSIDNLTVTYASARGPLTALRDLSLQVHDGEFVAVLGPSGCGKSTLLNIASGLLSPSKGQVFIHGEAVSAPRRDVGIIFQQPTLLPWKTVLQNVLVPMQAMGLAVQAHEERARQLIRLVRLEGFENHYPYELSGGMQQRVGIARGFMHDPQLLLMDEPFAALDAQNRSMLQDEMVRIFMEQRKTMVLVTHSIEEAIKLSDRIIVMTRRPGRVKADIEVRMPRPRAEEDPEFVALKARIRDLIHDEFDLSDVPAGGARAQ